ncbi:Zymogen granule protein 16-like protein B [Plecturocebus cupreus]
MCDSPCSRHLNSPPVGIWEPLFFPQIPGMRRPEPMLLLLSLALLGGPTWAGKMYGPGGGKYFSTTEDYDHEITGLRVSSALMVKRKEGGRAEDLDVLGHPRSGHPKLCLSPSVQVRLGDSWDVKQGASGGQTQEVILQQGEYIIKVFGAFKAFLQGMALCTNKDRCFYFGKFDGHFFSAYPSQEGQVLVGIYGEYGLLGIKGIGFEWNYPLEEPTTEPPVITPIT